MNMKDISSAPRHYEIIKAVIARSSLPTGRQARQSYNIMLKNKSGFTLLITILIVGAVVLAIASTLFLMSVGAAKNIAVAEASARAGAMADACAEEALEKIRESTTFIGYGTLSLGGESCGYLVTGLGGQNRRVVASSTVSDVVRKVKITVDTINPLINVTSWQEVINL